MSATAPRFESLAEFCASRHRVPLRLLGAENRIRFAPGTRLVDDGWAVRLVNVAAAEEG